MADSIIGLSFGRTGSKVQMPAPDRHADPCLVTGGATMASTYGPTSDRNEIVADVATRLFGTSIARDAIITETLKRPRTRAGAQIKG